jgi:hypothetical protein
MNYDELVKLATVKLVDRLVVDRLEEKEIANLVSKSHEFARLYMKYHAEEEATRTQNRNI